MDENETHLAPQNAPYLASLPGLLFLPVFLGCLGSLVFSGLVSGALFSNVLPVSYRALVEHTTEEVKSDYIEAEKLPADSLWDFGPDAADSAEVPLAEKIRFFTGADRENGDLIQELYRQPESRYRVIEFFEEICPSTEIAGVILANADLHSIPPALALALAWEESRLNHLAVNTKNSNGSIDRGLFQLNNQSFPYMELQDYFDPELNAQYGMGHLRFCLDTGGTEIAALAMYNAGTGRVRDTGAPKTTLDYVSRILENRQEIERSFLERETVFRQRSEIAVEIAEVKPEPGRQRFVTLTPLAGMR